MRRLCIITARAGSKGLPDKNMLMVEGKPLLAYSIESALEAGVFERIVLTTDSQEYIDCLSHYPIDFRLRPEHLASDTATSFDAIKDVIELEPWADMDYFVLFQPTSPLRKVEHVRELCERFDQHWEQYDFMASVSNSHKPTVLTRPIDQDGSMKYFDIDYSSYRRQNYLPEYSPNGVYFVAKLKAYLEHKHFYGAKSLAYFMDKNDAMDIDDREDFEQFYMVMQRRNRKRNLLAGVQRELQHKAYEFLRSAPLALVGDAHLALWPTEAEASLGTYQDLSFSGITAQQYSELVLPRITQLAPRVIISLGINDLRMEESTPEAIAQQVLHVVQTLKARAPEARLQFVEIPQTLFRVDCRNAAITALNQALQPALVQMGVEWVQVNDLLTNAYGKLRTELTTDGLHLLPEAYALIRTRLAL